jgi:hypothetical protein
MVLDASMRRWMKEQSVGTGDVGEVYHFSLLSSGTFDEPRCLEILGRLETKKPFLARTHESLGIRSLLCLEL